MDPRNDKKRGGDECDPAFMDNFMRQVIDEDSVNDMQEDLKKMIINNFQSKNFKEQKIK